MFPDDLLYTEDHEWIRDDGAEYVVGITSYATGLLGDVTYVELPEAGIEVGRGETVSTVESIKAASDVYSPVSGRLCEVNDSLDSEPELINQEPYGEGWIFKLEDIKIAELKRLMNAEAYAAYIETLK